MMRRLAKKSELRISNGKLSGHDKQEVLELLEVALEFISNSGVYGI